MKFYMLLHQETERLLKYTLNNCMCRCYLWFTTQASCRWCMYVINPAVSRHYFQGHGYLPASEHCSSCLVPTEAHANDLPGITAWECNGQVSNWRPLGC